MTNLIAVTGATGNIGKALTERLLQSGVKVRAVARNTEKLASLAAKGAEICIGELEDKAFLKEVFHGADAVFAMIPPHYTSPDIRANQRRVGASLIQGIKDAGITRVVALSSLGAELPSGTGPIAGLYDFEEMLKSTEGLSVVALRPGFFMENHLNAIPIIKNVGINGSAIRADAARPMIATRDIAAVAAEYLIDPTFDGYTVRELLGPRDYTYSEATSILGAAIGKPDMAYVEFSYEDFHKSLLGAGFSPNTADIFVEMYTAINEGRIKSVTERSTFNTTPTKLEEFAHEVFAPVYGAN